MLATVFVVTVVALAASVTGIAATNASSASGTLVIDNSFVIRTADPRASLWPITCSVPFPPIPCGRSSMR